MNDHSIRENRARLLLGLIGSGIQASLTPAMHEREAAEHGLLCLYQLIDLDSLGTAGGRAARTPRRRRAHGLRRPEHHAPLQAVGAAAAHGPFRRRPRARRRQHGRPARRPPLGPQYRLAGVLRELSPRPAGSLNPAHRATGRRRRGCGHRIRHAENGRRPHHHLRSRRRPRRGPGRALRLHLRRTPCLHRLPISPPASPPPMA